MATALREQLNKTKRLRDIQVSTLSPDFKKLSKKELLKILDETKQLIIKIGGTDHDHTFRDIESRINERLSSVISRRRFLIQVGLSIVILSLSILALLNESSPLEQKYLPKQKQAQVSK